MTCSRRRRSVAASAITSRDCSYSVDRNKTLTGLAGAAPIVEAQEAPAQRLPFFLSESTWDAEAVNARCLELTWADAEIAPHAYGVLVIDETDDRKDGVKTAHVAHQYLGSVGKIANGIVFRVVVADSV